MNGNRWHGVRASLLAASCVVGGAVGLGCDGAAREELRVRERDLELKLVEKQEIAQHLNEYRREVEQLSRTLSEARTSYHWPDPEELTKLLSAAGVKKVSSEQVDGVLRVRFGDDGKPKGLGAAMAALAPVQRAVTLRQVSVTDRDWSVELEVPPVPVTSEPPPPSPTPLKSPPPLPRCSRFFGDECERLTSRNQQIQVRLDMLDAIAGEVALLEHRRKHLQSMLKALEQVSPADRLVGTRPAVERLFTGKAPLLTRGTAAFKGNQVKLTGLGGSNNTTRVTSLAEVGKVLSAGPEGIELALTPAP
jgi:prefoldin subunit 5